MRRSSRKTMWMRMMMGLWQHSVQMKRRHKQILKVPIAGHSGLFVMIQPSKKSGLSELYISHWPSKEEDGSAWQVVFSLPNYDDGAFLWGSRINSSVGSFVFYCLLMFIVLLLIYSCWLCLSVPSHGALAQVFLSVAPCSKHVLVLSKHIFGLRSAATVWSLGVSSSCHLCPSLLWFMMLPKCDCRLLWFGYSICLVLTIFDLVLLLAWRPSCLPCSLVEFAVFGSCVACMCHHVFVKLCIMV